MADIESTRGGEWPKDAPQRQQNFGPQARPSRWGGNEGGGHIPAEVVFDAGLPQEPSILTVGPDALSPEARRILRQNPVENK